MRDAPSLAPINTPALRNTLYQSRFGVFSARPISDGAVGAPWEATPGPARVFCPKTRSLGRGRFQPVCGKMELVERRFFVLPL